MRFKLFGDLDCPDWIIAHFNLLSKLSSIKIKMLCNEVVNSVSKDKVNFEKLMKMTSDAKFSEDDCKASFATLSFILKSAWKFNVDQHVLSNELQQLGLPQEHALSLTKVYLEKLEDMRDVLKSKSLRINQFVDASCLVLDTIESKDLKVHTKLAVLDIDYKKGDQVCHEQLALTPEKLSILLNDLKQIKNSMD